ncbi:MAG: ATPase, partial [Treponema sp.]|nr:ATPase [Treponema sp.]
FLIRKKRKICPIEVKSSSYQRHTSINKFYRKYSDTLGQAYILYTKDIMEKDGILYLPVYMTMFL